MNSGNRDATDLVTDGASIWVLNNTSTDKVFKYTLSGTLQGSWTISGSGGSPTGLSIDPANVSGIWVVDSTSDRVYDFTSAASRTSGSQSPASSIVLASTNTNPQGIADPPTSVSGLTSPNSSSSTDSGIDSALLSIVSELNGLLVGGKKRKWRTSCANLRAKSPIIGTYHRQPIALPADGAAHLLRRRRTISHRQDSGFLSRIREINTFPISIKKRPVPEDQIEPPIPIRKSGT